MADPCASKVFLRPARGFEMVKDDLDVAAYRQPLDGREGLIGPLDLEFRVVHEAEDRGRVLLLAPRQRESREAGRTDIVGSSLNCHAG